MLKESGPGGWDVVEVQDYNGLQQDVKWRSRHPMQPSNVELGYVHSETFGLIRRREQLLGISGSTLKATDMCQVLKSVGRALGKFAGGRFLYWQKDPLCIVSEREKRKGKGKRKRQRKRKTKTKRTRKRKKKREREREGERERERETEEPCKSLETEKARGREGER